MPLHAADLSDTRRHSCDITGRRIKREPPQPPKPRQRPPRLGPDGTSSRRSPAASTCFVGIPSDRILFPSDRGDRTSFFQYMNEAPRPKSRRAESGQTVGNHPRIQVDAARRASVLRGRRAAAKPGSKSSWPRVLLLVSTFAKSGWLQEEPERRGFYLRGWLLAGLCRAGVKVCATLWPVIVKEGGGRSQGGNTSAKF